MTVRSRQIRAAAAVLRARIAGATGAHTLHDDPLDAALELLELSAFDDPTLDQTVDGELNLAAGTVRLRPGLSNARRRFIVAHELGHATLEGGDGRFADDAATLDERAWDDEAAAPTYSTRERREREANRFAAELLVPADDLALAVQSPHWSVAALAELFGVSHDLIRARLVSVCCLEPPATIDSYAQPHSHNEQQRSPLAPVRETLALEQREAIAAPTPVLVVAGPGTGKTSSLVAKYLALVAEGVDPAHILALTFSNKAAEELRARIAAGLERGQGAEGRERRAVAEVAGADELLLRVEVWTFHAWGLNFLAQYGDRVGLPPSARLRSPGDLFVLLRKRLAELPLSQYKDLRQPAMFLPQILRAISRAKDELCDPHAFARLAHQQAERLVAAANAEHASKTTKAADEARERAARDGERLRELAAIYARYEAILAGEQVLDYGDLIARSVQALNIPAVAAAARDRHRAILVDEFQDINYAAGRLVALLDGGRGCVWAVGDPWQSIYRFRGASPANLQGFAQDYPGAAQRELRRSFRSAQAILDAAHALMTPDPLATRRESLVAEHPARLGCPVVEWVAPDAEAEASAIAHDILRRVRPHARLACLRRGRKNPQIARIDANMRVSHNRTPDATTNVVPDQHSRRLAQFADRSSPQSVDRLRFRDHVVLCRTHTQAARVAATLAAHGVPVDSAGDIFDAPEVKDALAVLDAAGGGAAGLLRALTIPEHAIPPHDLALLARQAHARATSLARAARDVALHAALSDHGRQGLRALLGTLDALSANDAWQALADYLFARSGATRERIARAAQGDPHARRALAALGQVLVVAAGFVRQAAEGEHGPAQLIAHIRLLVESGETTRAAPLAERADVVRVMTVHAAKGLEFPAVYVPGLAEGQFPARSLPGSIPDLPEMIHGDLGDELHEERYLLYVAMTRARDRLVLCRPAARGGKSAARSKLLPDPAPWPMVVQPPARGCPASLDAARVTAPAIIRDPLPATSLETYERCPRQFLYQYGYQLYDDLSPYLRMHQAIRDVTRDLSARARTEGLPPDEAALRELAQAAFVARELEGTLYAEEYFAGVLHHAAQVWAGFRAGERRPEDVDRVYVVQRPAGTIAVRVDRVEHEAGQLRLVRVRAGRERSADRLSTAVMLYALAAEQHHGGGAVSLHYPVTAALRDATPKPNVLQNHTARIDRLLEGLRDERWSPQLGPQCAACAFNLICPA
jgi:DNA helicase-2/ATP-dependent DNA helicase PcrA